MKIQDQSKRKRERLELSLPARVHCRESADHEWIELTRLIDVTPFGARFPITHPSEPGRLLHLTLPMPRQLRCFDHVEQQYRVWSLVRNIKAQVPEPGKPQRFEVGVAFIGKRPPVSYEQDPTKRFEVAKTVSESGLWALQELPTGRRVPVDEPRPDTRHSIPIEVTVEIFDETGQVSSSETTVTENISRRGAAVFSTLELAGGRFVRLTSSQYNLSIIAAVRARRLGRDGIPRLHLEFINQDWPL
jgi:PilZ domain